ncbi:MAG TPA: hypothetical protein PLD25_11900 [Chloroflexota bacterium]|nr:hypothetical protein [Chloroflexota bacterium]HUM71168.1 hypothetical protein [Chloroflexota bacterium]
MTIQHVTLPLPEHLYLRIEQVAKATQQSVTDVLLHAVEVGSPPGWDDVPAEFQTDLAALDRLDDKTLWQIARSQQKEADMDRYEDLLQQNANDVLTAVERDELARLRQEADRFMLRKAHAAALLRWRGYQLPPADKL